MDVLKDYGLLITIATLIGSGGFAWGGTLMALNGTKKKVSNIESTLTQHVKDDIAVQIDAVDRLARIETKLDSLLE